MSARSVLIPVDESKHSEDALTWYSRNLYRDGDNVFVLHVFEPLHPRVFGFSYSTNSPEWSAEIEKREAKVTEVANNYKTMCSTLKMKAKILVETGKPGEVINAVSGKENVSFVVIGSRGMSKLRRTLIGGVSDYVIQHSKCPVLIVPPS